MSIATARYPLEFQVCREATGTRADIEHGKFGRGVRQTGHDSVCALHRYRREIDRPSRPGLAK
jgi:hypothetical protein